MEEPGARPQQAVEEDPLAFWKFASSWIVSAGVIFVLCRQNGIGTFCNLLLFFPVKSIVGGILENRIRKIFGGILLLLIYPVLLNSAPLIHEKVLSLFHGQLPGKSAAVVENAGFAGAFFIAMLLCAVAAQALPQLKFPERLAAGIRLLVFAAAVGTALIAVWVALNYCNGRFLRYPAMSSVILPAILAILGISVFCRILKLTLKPEKQEKDKTESRLLGTRPKTKLADVAGMEEVKEQIRLRLIEPIRNPALAKKYGLPVGGGVLLYGPPGTGKTFLARAVAGELNLPFYMITAADVFGKYVGESEKNILELFRNARKHPLSVVFVDEMETIFGKRTENIHESTQKVISVILQELDGVDQNKNPILLMGATNTPWKVDEAFLRPGRFDILAFVDLPDSAARQQILNNAFRKSALPLESGLLEYVSQNTQQYSGADLNGIVAKMQQRAFRTKAKRFTKQLAYEILRESPPPATHELLARIREWEARRRSC